MPTSASASFFGITTNETDKSVDCEVDGWVKPENRVGRLTKSRFSRNPLPMLRQIMDVRRKWMGYDLTHIGRVLRARRLTRKDIEGDTSSAER